MKCASDYKDLTGDGGDKHSVNYRVTSCNQLRANTNVAGPWFWNVIYNMKLQLKTLSSMT
jgi:hypothetical protein